MELCYKEGFKNFSKYKDIVKHLIVCHTPRRMEFVKG